ncbi:hybrid sensor histidine kinase/response regulator [Anaeromyxobacter oryzae]|uniref:histidine kinase n=1 Tax=Anaeromyxobacter oryzae TaxID=2918170 RepID=A0ABN6MWX3_9BACT|nr:hybrid sensor histidine kinase/response regulator [Anaeromyxobacter oryzae]BDG05462.1 hypothetical protein AMOR_44580 [Anaeromyxobacter oryzae]
MARLGVEDQRSGGVLLVDDEALNLKVLADLLADDWTVHCASSGAEALELAAHVPLDVVVADQRMPGMTGVELLEELRRRRPDLAGIVLTAYSDLHALESAINRANVFRFMRKPWEAAEILRALEQAAAHVVQRRTIDRLVTLLANRSEELRASLDQVQHQQQVMLHLERLGTIGQLSAGVTHDLRNVMVALRSADWEMTNAAVSPAMREIIGLGLAGIDNLLRTLQTLHEYARTGALELQLARVDPATVLHDAIAIARMDLAFKLRRVRSEAPAGLPPVAADRQKLTQVLVNLVRNALHVTPNGASVRVLAASRDDGAVEFVVEDEGPGVPPEIRERLFRPFVSTKGDQGLGLGLYMARLIVDSHGGRIQVADRAGGGGRFEVILPAARAAEDVRGHGEGG